MRVVKIAAGLGNQLFQYAFYRKIKKMYGECYVDLGWFDYKDRFAWYPYQLDVLGLNADKIDRDKYCVKEYYMQNKHIDEEEFNEISTKMKVPIVNLMEEKTPYSCDNLWEYDNAYYMGCFQNIDNILEVLDDIKNEVVFPYNPDESFQLLKRKIKNDNAVGLHIRLDDYAGKEDFEQVCPMQYYYHAIEYMKEHIENPVFYVFSNKIEKAKEKLADYKDFIFVDVNDRYHGIGDMELMSLCKNMIIPNSTFSWWGAVLNKNSSKIVIAPNKFNAKLKNVKDEDINLWFGDWIRIS